MSNEIIILFNGYSFMDPDKIDVMKSNCSCVLIKNEHCNIIIDTMTPWDGPAIVDELLKYNVTPKDIAYVISTHGHSDHVGNNNLFLNALHIVGNNISYKTDYMLHNFNENPYLISNNISVISTPGHTLSCVSVKVADAIIHGRDDVIPKTVIVAGDLFENGDDPFDENIWLSAYSENPTLQRINRSKIANQADYIVPGHGKEFRVTDEIRKILTVSR